jgi:asparagine N-glycosylation enzyme membrane subunit Stt3
MPNITEERLAELADNWNEETNDPETQEWRDGLTPEEAKIIDDWDYGYSIGVHNICQAILAMSREGERHG